MKLSHFSFDLPPGLLTEYPSDHRDECRLMVLDRKKETIEHKSFKDIVDYFDEGDAFVLNNTKVFPARLMGNKEKTGARIEVFLLRELSDEQRLWDVLVDPARKIRIGNKLYFGEDNSLVAEFIDNTTKHRSMSVGKSIVSYVAGHAICAGYIDSVDSKIDDWPLLKNTLYDGQKLIDILNMAAGDQKYISGIGDKDSTVFLDGYEANVRSFAHD